MMSYSQIIAHRERAERASQRAGKLPVFISGLGEDAVRRARIPFIGTRTPRGFERLNVGAVFGDKFGYGTAGHQFLLVDSSGFGAPGELALTMIQFSEFVQRNPGYAYGVIEAGQFQCVVGVYRRRPARVKRAAGADVAAGERMAYGDPFGG